MIPPVERCIMKCVLSSVHSVQSSGCSTSFGDHWDFESVNVRSFREGRPEPSYSLLSFPAQREGHQWIYEPGWSDTLVLSRGFSSPFSLLWEVSLYLPFCPIYRDVNYRDHLQESANTIEKNVPFVHSQTVRYETMALCFFQTVYLSLTTFNTLNELLNTLPRAGWKIKCTLIKKNMHQV